jgi:hypothetical protein
MVGVQTVRRLSLVTGEHMQDDVHDQRQPPPAAQPQQTMREVNQQGEGSLTMRFYFTSPLTSLHFTFYLFS